MSTSDQLTTYLLESAIESPAEISQTQDDLAVRCNACGHRCLIPRGKAGVCRIRFNRNGKLLVPCNTIAGLQADPIEKKPFYHVMPGSLALSFGGLGCNFHCDFCQNWLSSQTFRDPQAVVRPRRIEADQLIELAIENQAPAVVATYNEPLISVEWIHDVFEKAREKDLLCGIVSNGYATPESLDYLQPLVKMFKVDLKTFDDEGYRSLGGKKQVVLDTIAGLVQRNIWVEIVTLIVPTFNDDEENLKGIAHFIASLSKNIPWHVTAFHPDYKKMTPPRTSTDILERAWQFGKEAGLNHVYAGNRHGNVGSRENTFCQECNATLIRRVGFHVEHNSIVDGKCHACQAAIAGIWKQL